MKTSVFAEIEIIIQLYESKRNEISNIAPRFICTFNYCQNPAQLNQTTTLCTLLSKNLVTPESFTQIKIDQLTKPSQFGFSSYILWSRSSQPLQIYFGMHTSAGCFQVAHLLKTCSRTLV